MLFRSGEGSNLYYTNARVWANVSPTLALKANVADLTTSNVSEGSNLYFTNPRVYSNVTQMGYATTTHVSSELANLVSSAPSTLDTLNELAAALGNDPSFATTVPTSIGNARNQANAAYNQANTAITYGEAAFDKANVVQQSLTTANVAELTNLYYTDARSYANTNGISTLNNLTSVGTIVGGTWHGNSISTTYKIGRAHV